LGKCKMVSHTPLPPNNGIVHGITLIYFSYMTTVFKLILFSNVVTFQEIILAAIRDQDYEALEDFMNDDEIDANEVTSEVHDHHYRFLLTND